MRLKDILEAHQKYKVKNSLPYSLGDAYLMKTNPIFKNIREVSLELGFRFTKDPFHDYDVLPLTQLPKILATKTVPYRDNVSGLKEIEKKAPDVFGWNEVPPLKSNHVLHESAHGVARELKLIYFKKLKPKKGEWSQNQEIVLNTFVEESFSNAVECMANVYLSEEIEDEFFFKNAYIMEKPAFRKALREAVSCVGLQAAFRLVMISFLYANFVKTKVTAEEFGRVLKVVFLYEEEPSLNAKQIAVLRKAFQVGLELDPTFTIFTNSFCLRLMGVEENLYELVDFDFLKAFEKEGAYATWLAVLSTVV